MIRGNAWVFGDNIDTDVIVPGKYLVGNLEQITGHVMEGVRPGFAQLVKPGDVLVAGRNFGAGSSREMAPAAIRASGIAAVVAVSFARIYFRNSINIGLPPVECPRGLEIKEGDTVEVDLGVGVVRIRDRSLELPCVSIPGEIRRILDVGGLEAFLASEMEARA